MAAPATSRLMSEARDVASQSIPTVFAQPEESNLHRWHAMIRKRAHPDAVQCLPDVMYFHQLWTCEADVRVLPSHARPCCRARSRSPVHAVLPGALPL